MFAKQKKSVILCRKQRGIHPLTKKNKTIRKKRQRRSQSIRPIHTQETTIYNVFDIQNTLDTLGGGS